MTSPAAPTPYDTHESVDAELALLSKDEISERFDKGQPFAPQSALASLRSEWFFTTNTVPADQTGDARRRCRSTRRSWRPSAAPGPVQASRRRPEPPAATPQAPRRP